jgi:hypothetical protein
MEIKKLKKDVVGGDKTLYGKAGEDVIITNKRDDDVWIVKHTERKDRKGNKLVFPCRVDNLIS